MTENEKDWRWVSAEGVETKVDKAELVSALSAATLPPYTLVWRSGWAQWVPACRVPEFAGAVGDQAGPPVVPKQAPAQTSPPAPPLFWYKVYEARRVQRAASQRPPSVPPPSGGTPRAPVSSPPPPSVAPPPAASPGAPSSSRDVALEAQTHASAGVGLADDAKAAPGDGSAQERANQKEGESNPDALAREGSPSDAGDAPAPPSEPQTHRTGAPAGAAARASERPGPAERSGSSGVMSGKAPEGTALESTASLEGKMPESTGSPAQAAGARGQAAGAAPGGGPGGNGQKAVARPVSVSAPAQRSPSQPPPAGSSPTKSGAAAPVGRAPGVAASPRTALSVGRRVPVTVSPRITAPASGKPSIPAASAKARGAGAVEAPKLESEKAESDQVQGVRPPEEATTRTVEVTRTADIGTPGWGEHDSTPDTPPVTPKRIADVPAPGASTPGPAADEIARAGSNDTATSSGGEGARSEASAGIKGTVPRPSARAEGGRPPAPAASAELPPGGRGSGHLQPLPEGHVVHGRVRMETKPGLAGIELEPAIAAAKMQLEASSSTPGGPASPAPASAPQPPGVGVPGATPPEPVGVAIDDAGGIRAAPPGDASAAPEATSPAASVSPDGAAPGSAGPAQSTEPTEGGAPVASEDKARQGASPEEPAPARAVPAEDRASPDLDAILATRVPTTDAGHSDEGVAAPSSAVTPQAREDASDSVPAESPASASPGAEAPAEAKPSGGETPAVVPQSPGNLAAGAAALSTAAAPPQIVPGSAVPSVPGSAVPGDASAAAPLAAQSSGALAPAAAAGSPGGTTDGVARASSVRPTPALDEPDLPFQMLQARAASRKKVLKVAAGLAVVVGGGVVASQFLSRSAPPAREPALSVQVEAASSSPVGAATPPKQCQLARGAQRLDAKIDQRVPLELLAVPDAKKVAIGFASEPTTAVGLMLDLESFKADQSFLDEADAPVRNVIPVLSLGKAEFRVDRTSEEFTYQRTVGPQLIIGATPGGFARKIEGPPEVVWPNIGVAVTKLSVASAPSAGHAVAFREGEQVLVGWLKGDGSKASDPRPVKADEFVGSPAIAASDSGLLVAFASRPDKDAKWGVALGSAEPGAVPEQARPFVIPPGGPGIETISPSVTGLPGGRWLVQWTEGGMGSRQVRVQTLAKDLAPVGDAITLSAPEDNAGQGVAYAAGTDALSLFIVIRGEERQLWGAKLTCP